MADVLVAQDRSQATLAICALAPEVQLGERAGETLLNEVVRPHDIAEQRPAAGEVRGARAAILS